MALTRRNFVVGSAVTAGLLGLAACGGESATTAGGDEAAAADLPSADQYPIDPDGSDPIWTAEETRDGWTRVTADGAPELGIKDAAKIITIGGLPFKDLNGNGKLDLYEDWRQPHDVRAAALAQMMSAEDAMLLMWHGGDEPMSMGPGGGDDSGEETVPHALCVQGSRAGVSRLQSTIDSYATDIAWINEVQAVCEDSTYGVPYLNSTDQYQLYNIPDNVALSATMDKDIWRKAGMFLGRAWRATGVRCLLGPQVDVYSSPIGCRLSGSVCEDPAVNRDFAAAFSGGLQSTWGDDAATDDLGWGKDSVAAMLKHYVGEGCAEGGRNDHSSVAPSTSSRATTSTLTSSRSSMVASTLTPRPRSWRPSCPATARHLTTTRSTARTWVPRTTRRSWAFFATLVGMACTAPTGRS